MDAVLSVLQCYSEVGLRKMEGVVCHMGLEGR